MGLRKEEKEDTPLQKLQKIVGNLDKAKFVRWYCTPEKQRQSFEEWVGNINGKQRDTCEGWLLEEKVQEAVTYWMSITKKKNLMDIYLDSINRALGGDPKAIEIVFKEAGNKTLFDNTDNSTHELLQDIRLNLEKQKRK